jgi:hypothetical protein
MEIDYPNLERDVADGRLRETLKRELVEGFQKMQSEGERLPPPSYYATKITEVIHAGTERVIDDTLAYDLYQEVLLACEEAYEEVSDS